MLETITRINGSIARRSANKPIHFIIITALLASVAYLSVVDEYVPEQFRSNHAAVYYHAPGSQSFGEWQAVDDVSAYPEADAYTVTPLRFKTYSHAVPEIEGAIHGVYDNERVLISRAEDLEKKLSAIDKIAFDGVTWKARHNNRVTKYYEYLRTAALKTRDAIRGAENFDIGSITIAYIAMWYTLIKVFFDMKKVGSNFWLAFSTLTSSTFAFLFALVFTTRVLDTKVPLLSITEGIPFLVAIIGFKHKVLIAATVSKASNTHLDVKTIVADAISVHTISLLRDHFVVIGVVLSCAAYAPHLDGLRNFCVLSAAILAFDLLLVYTFFSAILALKVEINRARRTEDLKEALEEDGVSSLIAANVASQASHDLYPDDDDSLFKSNTILSLKLALILGFFGFHAFWLGSSWLYSSETLSPSSLFTTASLSETTASHIKVGPNGTLVTLNTPRVYMPLGYVVFVEDLILKVFETVSSAIRDNLISKCLLFAFIVSIFTNAYFLNASRYQVSATHKLIQKTMESPKEKSIEKVKTNVVSETESDDSVLEIKTKLRSVDECAEIMKAGKTKLLQNAEIASLVVAGKLPLYALEKTLGDNTRAVVVRRKAIAKVANAPILDSDSLPYAHYDYDRVFGACCENVVGFIPIPVGIAGPLIIDGKPYHIPIATTEGCLVASAMRGCKAINAGGGVETVLTQDGMTRGPCVSFPSLKRAGACKLWLDSEEGQKTLQKAFNSTSRFARLQNIKTALAGNLLFMRFRTTTGDAMGMNMISKGCEYSLKYMIEECGWDDMEIISLSGNYCIDKKPSAMNWIEGRGKSVVAEARIPADVVKKVLKSDVDALCELNVDKNLIGSSMAGSIGGNNAHAANLVTAIYIACGQDPAQNVVSSNCMTLMNNVDGDLVISVSMPSIEVGTIGGGTILEPQGAMLDLLGVRGPHPTNPGDNARQLAKCVASAVLAAELSLCSALAAGHLVASHMQHNRKGAAPAAPAAPAPTDIQRLKEGSVNCIKS